jgi:hypothetical protein
MNTDKSDSIETRRAMAQDYRRGAENAEKPTATAARFDETVPAAINSTTTAKATSTSTTPASKTKTGGRYKFNDNVKCKTNVRIKSNFKRWRDLL